MKDLIAKITAQKKKLAELDGTIKTKNIIIQKLNLDKDHIRDRIVKLYGREALKNILNSVDTPNGFDALKFDKVCRMSDDSPKGKALSQSSVLCQMHLNGDLSFAELFNGLLQVKNKLEREELAEIDSDYKESLKDSFE